MPDIRTLLRAAEPAPAGTVDVAAIITRGHQLRRRRRAAVASPLLLLGVLAAPFALVNSNGVEELEVTDRRVTTDSTVLPDDGASQNPTVDGATGLGGTRSAGESLGISGGTGTAVGDRRSGGGSRPGAAPMSTPSDGVIADRGGRIAYASAKHGDWDIFTAKVDGTDVRRLTSTPEADMHPAWSPDRRQIAFTRRVDPYKTDIYVMDADGGNVRRLTTAAGLDEAPAWSPDGSRIAFVSDREGVAYGTVTYQGQRVTRRSTELWLMDANGSDQEVVVRTELDIYNPTWSPDGTQIAIERYDRDRVAGDIVAVDLTDRTIRLVFRDESFNMDPAWSPDGSRIAFRAVRGGASQLAVVNAFGGDFRLLTSGGGFSMFPAWSSDGRRLLFSYDVDGPRYHRGDQSTNVECSAVRETSTSSPADFCPAGPLPSELRVLVLDGGGVSTVLAESTDSIDGAW